MEASCCCLVLSATPTATVAGSSPAQKGVNNDFLENSLLDSTYMPIATGTDCRHRRLASSAQRLHHDAPQRFRRRRRGRRRPAQWRSNLSGEWPCALPSVRGIRDESKLVMDGEAFLEKSLPPDLQRDASPFVELDREKVWNDYFELFEDLYASYNGAQANSAGAVMGDGASETFLRRVRDTSDGHGGTIVHMHLLQSPVQKDGACVATASRLSMAARSGPDGSAHGVRPCDLGHRGRYCLMGAQQVSVTTHPSCNFHMPQRHHARDANAGGRCQRCNGNG